MAESRNSLNEKKVGIVCELNVPLNAFEYGLPLAGVSFEFAYIPNESISFAFWLLAMWTTRQVCCERVSDRTRHRSIVHCMRIDLRQGVYLHIESAATNWSIHLLCARSGIASKMANNNKFKPAPFVNGREIKTETSFIYSQTTRIVWRSYIVQRVNDCNFAVIMNEIKRNWQFSTPNNGALCSQWVFNQPRFKTWSIF